ncbi:MAG TPA: transposase, partial [Gemmatirosa sp.]
PSADRIPSADRVPPAYIADRRVPLSEIVRAFKSFSARAVNAHRGTPGVPVWQRNYYEHIVRDADALRRIRAYIGDNPRRWTHDALHPAAAPRPRHDVR